MMRILKQKKLTCMIWAFTVLVNMITLAGKSYGMDIVERQYNNLSSQYNNLKVENESLVKELDQQKVQIQTMEDTLKSETGGKENTPALEQIKQFRENIKEDANTLEDALDALNKGLKGAIGNDLVTRLAVLQDAKRTSETKQLKAQEEIAQIKIMAGGSGANTPISMRLQKFRKNNETVKGLEKVLDVPENRVINEVAILKEMLKTTQEALIQKDVEVQHQIAEVKFETGEEAGDSPLPTRIRKLSNSLKKDTGNLKEAVNTLTEKLHNVSGEDCVDKVECLVTELEVTKCALRILAERLQGIPGDGLLEKVALLMAEREVTQDILENLEETITDKEDAYNTLYLELLRTKSEADYLDVELSKEQVAHSKDKEQLNDVLRKQFNS